MTQFLSELGKQIKTNRKRMGLSQVNASQMMDIDYRHYQNIEGGKINLRLDTLLKLFKFYSLSKDDTCCRMHAFDTMMAGQLAPVAAPHDPVDSLFHHLSRVSSAGLIQLNLSRGTIETANKKMIEILGYPTIDSLKVLPASDLIEDSDLNLLQQSVTQTLPPARISPVVAKLKGVGQTVRIKALLIPQRNVGGTDMNISCVVFDRTGLELAKEQMHMLSAEAQKLQNFIYHL